MMRGCFAIALVLLLPAAPAVAEGDPGVEAERSARLESMRASVELIRVQARNADGESVPLETIPDPLLRFNDPSRAHEDGTLWGWGRRGRPAATTEVWRNFETGTEWFHVVTALGSEPLTADVGQGRTWTPPERALRLQRFPADEPRPPGSPADRLRRMKELAGRFSAHEVWEEQRHELRLLSRPVHRYEDPEAGLIDGGLFVLANGTNPEVLLLIEAVRTDDGPFWMYGLARSGHAAMHVRLDGDEVWKQPQAGRTDSTDPYWLFSTPLEPGESDPAR